MTWKKAEGIVLQSTVYQAHHRIIKIFTKEKGLLSFFVKNVTPQNNQLVAVCSPLSYGEWIYQKSKGDLYSAKDSTLLDSFLALRNRLESLQTAGALLQAIILTQLPNKPSSALFALLVAYLRKIPEFNNPLILKFSFYLKLLSLESLLHIHTSCSQCKEQSSSIVQGENVCTAHAIQGSPTFLKEELSILVQLTYAKKFSDMQSIALPSQLIKKLERLLSQQLGFS